jgi:hypothetical protein
MEEGCRRDRADSETQRLSCWILMGITLRRYVLGKNECVGISTGGAEKSKQMQKGVSWRKGGDGGRGVAALFNMSFSITLYFSS